VPDDDVVVDAEIEQIRALHELPGEPQVLPARGRIAARVLCSRMIEAADSRMAGLKTSRGWTRLAESVPSEITTSRRSPFWASSSATRKTSFLRSSISGP
jgi:hypothetical protein